MIEIGCPLGDFDHNFHRGRWKHGEFYGSAGVVSFAFLKHSHSRGVIPLMSSPRLAAISILGLTTITAAGFAFIQYQRAEELANLLALAQSPQAPASERARPATPPVIAPEIDAAPKIAAKEEEAEAPAERERPERRQGGRGDMTAKFEKLMADPEFANAFNAQQRARLDGRYAELFAKLNLPPETLTQLQDLMTEKQNSARDVYSAAQAEGLGRENRAELREIVQMTQNEINREIENLIGESGVVTMREYEQTTAQRNLVGQLETRLSYAASPLNDAQASAMVNILSQTSNSDSGRGRGSNDGDTRNVAITDDTIARAQAVLSGDQLQALSDLQAEQKAAQTVSAAMRQTFQRGGGGDGNRGDSRGPGG